MAVEKEKSNSMVETKHKRLEEQLTSKKEMASREREHLQQEMDQIQDGLADLRKQSSLTVYDMNRQLQQDKAR